MKRAFVLLSLAPALAFASVFDEAARLSDGWRKGSAKVIEQAARVPWPALDPALEAAVAERVEKLSPEARRVWAFDRALPVLAGELAVPDDVLRELVETLEHEIPAKVRDGELSLVSEARRLYARGEYDGAANAYADVKRSSALWPDALRERAWTLLLLGRPADALGASVSLRAPWFPSEDHAEARLLEASVLLERCRWKEARERVEPLSAPGTKLDPAQVRAVLTAPKPPDEWRDLLEAPLVARVRTLLKDMPQTQAGNTRRAAALALGERLLSAELESVERARRDVARRALSVVYESLRGERGLREAGKELAKPKPVDPGPIADDEVAWEFDGRYWRDELGLYRYVAGDACPREDAP